MKITQFLKSQINIMILKKQFLYKKIYNKQNLDFILNQKTSKNRNQFKIYIKFLFMKLDKNLVKVNIFQEKLFQKNKKK